ncbi:HTH DNA binding domain protein [archaeon BMS3Bbin15]|nr:HTH DNA binding domain protein [archaeon BMS3Bbin15]
MIEAKLKIRMPETCAVAAVRASKAARVKLLDTAPHEMEGVKSLLQIESDACLDEVLSSISNRNVDEINKISDSNTKAAISVRRCIPARSIIEAGCFIKSAKHTEEGVEWDIIARRSSLIKLTEILEKNNYSFKIKRIGDLDLHKEIITNREMELLKYAVYQGYFDTPKNIGIRGVAKEFGISISTTSDMLRRGLKKILIDYFEGK